jgi:ribonuclease III
VTGSAIGQLRPEIEAALGHVFADKRLLDESLAHAARLGGRGRRYGRAAHERLEFLGDRVLGLIVAEALIERFPDEAEGALNLRLVELVRAETEAEIAACLGVERWLRARAGAVDGQVTTTLLADTLEALIAALYLDGGIETARGFVMRYWGDRFDAGGQPRRDAKTALQEWAQARGLALPSYRLVATSGPDHAPQFAVEVGLAGVAAESGSGPSKRIAEQEAAGRLLARLVESPA